MHTRLFPTNGSPLSQIQRTLEGEIFALTKKKRQQTHRKSDENLVNFQIITTHQKCCLNTQRTEAAPQRDRARAVTPFSAHRQPQKPTDLTPIPRLNEQHQKAQSSRELAKTHFSERTEKFNCTLVRGREMPWRLADARRNGKNRVRREA